jgi:CRP-like cAMP-binding protein
MQSGALGKVYQDGEIIIYQGEKGDCLYVIQEGAVEVYATTNGKEIHLAELGEGDFFGEMAVFDQTVRSTSVRALGQARVLTIDKRNLLRRMEEDPSLAFRFLEIMSTRMRGLDLQFAQMHRSEKRDTGSRDGREQSSSKFSTNRRVMASLVSNPGGSM